MSASDETREVYLEIDGQALSASPASPSPATGSPQPAEQERASPCSIAPNLIAPGLIAPRSTGPSPIVLALPVPHSVLAKRPASASDAAPAARQPGSFREPAGPGKSFGRPRPAGASSGRPRPAGAGKGRTSTTTSSGKLRRPGGFDKPRPGGARPSPAPAASANPAAVLRQRGAGRVGSSLASKPAPSVPAAWEHPNASRAARGTKAK